MWFVRDRRGSAAVELAVFTPILVLLTLPVTLLTLGLFIFVINGLMFLLAAKLLDGFVVDSFMAGVIGSALYSLISWLLTRLLPGASKS